MHSGHNIRTHIQRFNIWKKMKKRKMDRLNNVLLGTRLVTDEPFAYNTLIHVFKYLQFKDLACCAQVCPIWRWIVSDHSLWKSLMAVSCSRHVIGTAIELYASNIKYLELSNAGYVPIDYFTELCINMTNLIEIYLYGYTSIDQLKILAQNNTKLERLYAKFHSFKEMDTCFMTNFKNLTHLEIGLPETSSMKFLQNLKKLVDLSLTTPYPESVWKNITTLELLPFLRLSTPGYSRWVADFPRVGFEPGHLKNLEILHLSNVIFLDDDHQYNVLNKISIFPNLKDLRLQNISIYHAATSNFGRRLAQCHNIESLTITVDKINCYESVLDVGLENSEIFKGVLALKSNLTYFCWIIDKIRLTEAEEYFKIPNVMAFGMRELRAFKVISISLPELDALFKRKLPNTEVYLLNSRTVGSTLGSSGSCCFKCDTVVNNVSDENRIFSLGLNDY